MNKNANISIFNNYTDGYGYVQPHAPRMIIETPTGQDGCCDEDDPRIKKKLVTYDGNGNRLEIKEVVGEEEISMRKNLWDEENRLRAVDLNPDNEEHHNIAVYTYDASGQRILRHIPTRVDVYSNAVTSGQEERDVTMIYPSGLVTAKVLPLGGDTYLKYTKHYYVGAERISSVTGIRSDMGLFFNGVYLHDFFPSSIRTMSNDIVIEAGDALEEVYSTFDMEYTVPEPETEGTILIPGHTHYIHSDNDMYFFHPDHLGSSSYITNSKGIVTQHMEYLPFGELLVDEHLNSHNSPFKFNAKELDPETGNYYYGARYYSPKDNLMLSVDPMWEIYPGISPYAYTLQNPLRYVDPTGMMVEEADSPPDWYLDLKTGRVEHIEGSENLSSQGKIWIGEDDASIEELQNTLTSLGLENCFCKKDGDAVKGIYADTEEAYNSFVKTHNAEVLSLTKELMLEYGLVFGLNALFPLKTTRATGSAGTITSATKTGTNLALRPDIVLSGGRSGQLVKTLEGPANSVLKGGQGRIFITNDAGKVIWDVTKDRAKSVIPGQGFGPKVAPTQEQLNLLKQIWGN